MIYLTFLIYNPYHTLAFDGFVGLVRDFYNAPGYSRDWICIVGAGAPDTSAGYYQYMPNGAQRGVIAFRSPGPGRYEARAYYNYRPGQYYVSARYRFRVR